MLGLLKRNDTSTSWNFQVSAKITKSTARRTTMASETWFCGLGPLEILGLLSDVAILGGIWGDDVNWFVLCRHAPLNISEFCQIGIFAWSGTASEAIVDKFVGELIICLGQMVVGTVHQLKLQTPRDDPWLVRWQLVNGTLLRGRLPSLLALDLFVEFL